MRRSRTPFHRYGMTMIIGNINRQCHPGSLLLKLLGEQEFGKLPITARQQLLEGCGSVLESLNPAQQDDIIGGLPGLSSGERYIWQDPDTEDTTGHRERNADARDAACCHLPAHRMNGVSLSLWCDRIRSCRAAKGSSWCGQCSPGSMCLERAWQVAQAQGPGTTACGRAAERLYRSGTDA